MYVIMYGKLFSWLSVFIKSKRTEHMCEFPPRRQLCSNRPYPRLRNILLFMIFRKSNQVIGEYFSYEVWGVKDTLYMVTSHPCAIINPFGKDLSTIKKKSSSSGAGDGIAWMCYIYSIEIFCSTVMYILFHKTQQDTGFIFFWFLWLLDLLVHHASPDMKSAYHGCLICPPLDFDSPHTFCFA